MFYNVDNNNNQIKYFDEFIPKCKLRNEVKAIRNISFCLDYGEIFGLLGINGAGIFFFSINSKSIILKNG